MYQLIPENISQILLGRLFIFVCLFIVVMATVYLSQTQVISASPNSFELNKTGIIFPAFNLP
jgi:hypothetical protein